MYKLFKYLPSQLIKHIMANYLGKEESSIFIQRCLMAVKRNKMIEDKKIIDNFIKKNYDSFNDMMSAILSKDDLFGFCMNAFDEKYYYLKEIITMNLNVIMNWIFTGPKRTNAIITIINRFEGTDLDYYLIKIDKKFNIISDVNYIVPRYACFSQNKKLAKYCQQKLGNLEKIKSDLIYYRNLDEWLNGDAQLEYTGYSREFYNTDCLGCERYICICHDFYDMNGNNGLYQCKNCLQYVSIEIMECGCDNFQVAYEIDAAY